MRLVALILLLSSNIALAAEVDIGPKIEALAKSYVEWGPGMSTPGATLTYHEVSHVGRKRTYQVVVSGLPQDGTYALLQWPVTMEKPAVLMNPVFIDPSGLLMCVKGGDVKSSDDTVNLITDSIPGEPVRNAVVSLKDKNIRALAKMTEQPLEVNDKKCNLSVTYLTSRGAVVFVEASGLAAGEDFAIAMHSGSKNVKQEGKAPGSGMYKVSFLPIDPQIPSGNGVAQLRLQAPSCSLYLEFPWGNLSGK